MIFVQFSLQAPAFFPKIDMLKYSLPPLSPATDSALNILQIAVNNGIGRKDRYEIAKMLFKSKTSSTWIEVKGVLEKFAPSGKSCYYCERDRFRDIEHVMPKLHYPENCFSWDNYIYACAICNQDRKKDTFAVFDAAGNVVKFNRTHDINLPIPSGTHVFIDIRTEDPLNFLALDLKTGFLVPIGNALDKERGEFTKSLFDLNNSSLADIRAAAYVTYCHYLNMFKDALNASDPYKANRLFNQIKKLNHPTVLVEMRRQTVALPHLQVLFQQIPLSIGARPV